MIFTSFYFTTLLDDFHFTLLHYTFRWFLLHFTSLLCTSRWFPTHFISISFSKRVTSKKHRPNAVHVQLSVPPASYSTWDNTLCLQCSARILAGTGVSGSGGRAYWVWWSGEGWVFTWRELQRDKVSRRREELDRTRRCRYSTGLSKKMDGILNRYNLKSTGQIYTIGVLKCSEEFKVLDLP